MRYIEDIFFIWTESEDELEGFLQRLNAFHANLKFTHEKSKVSIKCLDVTVSINGEEFESDLYRKPIDCNQFLEFNSRHPIHNKKSIEHSQGSYSKKVVFENTLKVYVLALARTVTPKNWLTMKLGGFLKANQSNYFKVAQRLGLVYHLL